MSKPNIINAHTHIFKSTHIPRFLGKTYLPLYTYLLFPIQLIVNIFRFWYNGPYRWRFKPWYKRVILFFNYINKTLILSLIKKAIIAVLVINAFYALYDWLREILPGDGTGIGFIERIRELIFRFVPFIMTNRIAIQIVIVVVVLLFIPAGRKMIFFILKQPFKVLALLPSKQTMNYLKRYVSIGRFAFYHWQEEIFKKLIHQYPAGTEFVVLPMDMEFMDAGGSKDCYYRQMAEIAMIKNRPIYKDIMHPFVFADPRRIKRDKNYLKYSVLPSGEFQIENCFVKKYIEDKKFSGFKIYPALGYYPFDDALLPLWKYACDKQLPIMTHCIRGTIFYRGSKEKSWNHHPVFMQTMERDEKNDRTTTIPLLLPEMNNEAFSCNFTHPLNYLCLLKEPLLRILVQRSPNEDVRKMFGYTDAVTPLRSDLSKLKICFGHYGGDDEWNRYLESDRDLYSQEFLLKDEGIDFMQNSSGDFSWSKLEQLWKYTDWYSIISSMILQHPNVYSDISYIIHSPEILPLLNRSLQTDGRILNQGKPLRERILFGTDFYVVRNHSSEKNLHAGLLNALSEEEFDLIARTNPRAYLENTVHDD